MGIFSALIDLYENTRKTKSDKKDNKPPVRNYSFDSGLTGDRKIDISTPRISTKESKPREKDNGEER